MPTKSLRERAEDSLSRSYIRGYRKGQKDFAEKVKKEIKSLNGVFVDENFNDGLAYALTIIDKELGADMRGEAE